MGEQIKIDTTKLDEPTPFRHRRYPEVERRAKRWAYIFAEMSDSTYLALVSGERDVPPHEMSAWRKRSAERLKIALTYDFKD